MTPGPRRPDLFVPEEIFREQLRSGARVVSERMAGVASAAIGCWVPVGARDESAALAGASHFLEHLLFKGTADRSALRIANEVDARGGEMNAFTSKEHTAYYLRVPVTDFGWAIDLLGEVLSRPAFRPVDIDSERQVILEELHLNLDTPDDRVHTLLFEGLFPDHPVGREVLGESDTVRGMSREAIAGFHAAYYGPANFVVAVAGDVEHDRVLESVSSWSTVNDTDKPERAEPGPETNSLIVERRATEQAHLCLGWRAFDYDHPDRYALAVANQVFGGGASSRLFQEVRERRGLAYVVYSGPTAFTDCGALSVYAGCSVDRAESTLEVIGSVVDELVVDGITDDELEVARGFLIGSLLLGLEDSGSRMARLGSSEAIRGKVISIEEHVSRIEAVTTGDVARVLVDVFTAPRTVAAVGPFDADHAAFGVLT